MTGGGEGRAQAPSGSAAGERSAFSLLLLQPRFPGRRPQSLALRRDLLASLDLQLLPLLQRLAFPQLLISSVLSPAAPRFLPAHGSPRPWVPGFLSCPSPSAPGPLAPAVTLPGFPCWPRPPSGSARAPDPATAPGTSLHRRPSCPRSDAARTGSWARCRYRPPRWLLTGSPRAWASVPELAVPGAQPPDSRFRSPLGFRQFGAVR